MRRILICCLALLAALCLVSCAKLSPSAVADKIVEQMQADKETAAPPAESEEKPEATPVSTEIEVEVQMDAANYVILRSDNGHETGIYEYKDGLKSKVSYYNNETKELERYVTFVYDGDGNLTEYTEWTEDGELEDQSLYEYKDGMLYRETSLYGVGKVWAIYEYHYDENGVLDERYVLDEEDYEVNLTLRYFYDENGHLLRHECYDGEDMSFRTEFTCDDMGNVIHEETYFSHSPDEAQHVYDYEYIYNEHGQIIKENGTTYEYGPMP